jgi:hypothetical protein
MIYLAAWGAVKAVMWAMVLVTLGGLNRGEIASD